MVRYRNEKDVLGEVKVPIDMYYGPETMRAKNTFNISGTTLPFAFIKSYAIVKRSAALANMRAKKLDSAKGKAIVKAADDVIRGNLINQFSVDIFQAGAGTNVNMNLNEVIANRAIEILGGRRGNYKIINPNDHVNMSQSTNDTYPAAMRISIYGAITESLIPSLKRLEVALHKKSGEFSRVVKIGRTHLQDAVPMTLGQEFSGYAASIEDQVKNIQQQSQSLLNLSLGGTAIGTGIEADKRYSKYAVEEVRRYTGYRFKLSKNFFDLQSNKNQEEWVSSALKDLAISLNKIANDFRLLTSGPTAGFGDVTLPAMMPGSSIMPGKINPSIPEMLNMVCFQVIGNSTAVSESVQGGQLELNVYMPVILYDLLYSIHILSAAVDTFTKKCVVGIKANDVRLKQNLEKDISLATALAPYIGYAKAAQIARKAYKEGKTVRQVCLEMNLFTKKGLDGILNARKLAGVK